MGHWVNAMLLVSLASLTGCSLIYNPSNLPDPPGDGNFVDMRIIVDANPLNLGITSVEPTQLFEGIGTGGSRKGVIAVRGTDILDTAKISITVHGTGGPSTANITIDEANTDVSLDHAMIAVPVTIEIDTALDAGDKIRFDVTVTQAGPDGDVTATLTEKTPGADDAALEVIGFDELDGVDQSLATGAHDFSRVMMSGNLTATDNLKPLVVRANGGISIGGKVDVSSSGQSGGPNAGIGGDGPTGLAPGGDGGGLGGGHNSGGGGGFGTVGGGTGTAPGTSQGDAEITTIATGTNACTTGTAAKNCGSGGGGGSTVAGTGGDGGGGGGTIELTANGSITVGMQVLANGGQGGGGSGTNANGGGGGSGGLVLIRGASITVTGGISVAGGGPGNGAGINGVAGSTGGVGRIRLDAASPTIPNPTPTPYRGPTFVQATPVITRVERPMVSVLGQPDRPCTYQITSAEGAVSNFEDCTFGSGGTNMFALTASLFEGLNTVCIYVDKADTVTKLPEAKNCIQIVRLFTQ